jgi:hypothetical protein
LEVSRNTTRAWIGPIERREEEKEGIRYTKSLQTIIILKNAIQAKDNNNFLLILRISPSKAVSLVLPK